MSEKSDGWGLVFAGGGGKGAYEIGAWRALNEHKEINITSVAGTSVGALNALLFAIGNYGLAYYIWRYEVSPEVILTKQDLDDDQMFESIKDTFLKNKMVIIKLLAKNALRFKHLVKVPLLFTPVGRFSAVTPFVLRNHRYYVFLKALVGSSTALPLIFILEKWLEAGTFTREGLKKIITENQLAKYYKEKNMPCYVACYNVDSDEVEYFNLQKENEDKIEHILLASSAIPIAFPTEEIDGKHYWDGGLKDNTPIKKLYEEGVKKILVIHLDCETSVFSNIVSPGKGVKRMGNTITDKVYYKDATIVHMYPHSPLSGLVGTFDFRPKSIEKKMQQGYEETKKNIRDAGVFS